MSIEKLLATGQELNRLECRLHFEIKSRSQIRCQKGLEAVKPRKSSRIIAKVLKTPENTRLLTSYSSFTSYSSLTSSAWRSRDHALLDNIVTRTRR
jgi:hypothetical protein